MHQHHGHVALLAAHGHAADLVGADLAGVEGYMVPGFQSAGVIRWLD